jgi:hypothetical protein
VNESKNKSTFSLVLKTIFSIQEGCPFVNQIYYRLVPTKLLREQYYDFIAFFYLNSRITEILFKKPCNPNNKQISFQTKQTLSHCMIETKNGALSGWVLLGLYFHLNKQYKPAIRVLKYTKSLTSLGQYFVSIYSHISIRDMLSETNREYC